MKRFLIFGGQFPVRNGGWGDFKGDASDIFEATRIAQQFEWVHIVDTQQKKIIYEGKTVNGKWVGSAKA